MSDIGKLKPEIKAQWVAALRSGEYKQGRERLHFVNGDGDFFCCLGVLCDLAARQGVVEVSTREVSGDGIVEYQQRDDLPPRVVEEWAFAERPSGSIDKWSVHERDVDEDGELGVVGLAMLNDEHDLTFNEIADRVEADL